MKKANCIEVVRFSVKNSHTVKELKEKMDASHSVIQQFDGFVKRSISINEEGEFIDVVYWESKKQALEAAKEAMKNETLVQAFNLIEPSSIVMDHYAVFSSFE